MKSKIPGGDFYEFSIREQEVKSYDCEKEMIHNPDKDDMTEPFVMVTRNYIKILCKKCWSKRVSEIINKED